MVRLKKQLYQSSVYSVPSMHDSLERWQSVLDLHEAGHGMKPNTPEGAGGREGVLPES